MVSPSTRGATRPYDGGVLDYFVRHRTAANMLLILMLVGGVYAAQSIRAQFLPDVVLESATVTVIWPGAGSEDVDRAIIGLISPVLITLDGVESTSSTAVQGKGTIRVEFESGWEMARGVDDIKAAVDTVRNLPDTAEEPVVRRNEFRDRVTLIALYGAVPLSLVERYADELQARLFRAGVTRVSVGGIPSPTLRVAVPEAKLLQHGLTLQALSATISAEVEANASGQVGASGARVRTGTSRRTLTELGAIPVLSRPDGSKLYLRDVAEIRHEGSERGRVFFHGDQPAVLLYVERNESGDAIALQETVERVLTEMREALPASVHTQLAATRSEAITDRLGVLRDNAALGLGLVLIVLFLFLSAHTAFWVAAGIPIALAATIGLMYAFGLTLNMVSMFALIICLGIIVDDAIVVGEHADTLYRRGMSPHDAAVGAARRMAPPVFSAAVTTIIAFVALTSIGGRFGDLILDIPFTVAVVLLASLAECFLVLPMHMRHALGARRAQAWYNLPARVVDRGFQAFRHRLFEPALQVLLFTRYQNFAVALCLLLLTGALFAEGAVPWRFFNAPERGTVAANIAMLPGATREDTRAMLNELRRALDVTAARYVAEHGVSPVEFSLASLGGTMGRGLRGANTKDPDHLGGFLIELVDPDTRPYSAFAFLTDWQSEIVRSPKLELLALRGARSGPGGDAIDVQLLGGDALQLKDAAEDLKYALSRFDAVSALEDTLPFDRTELTLRLSPLAEALGFDTEQIGRALYGRLQGHEAAEFQQDTRTVKIRVSLPREELGPDFLYRARLTSPDGHDVALEDLVEIDRTAGFATVRRENGIRTLRVTGDISEDDPEAARTVSKALVTDLLPRIAGQYGIEYQLKGLHEQESRFLSDALTGLVLGLVGIYVVLAWIFGSWVRPVAVMIVIPLGLIGMVWGHYWHGVPLSMFSVVGFIGMAGIIINDSIVLITTIDQYGGRTISRTALITAVSERLRPVFLTTATTVLGMMPLLFEKSRQAQFLLPTVITLVYGLGFGLFLVLVITPSLVLIQRDVTRLLTTARRAPTVMRRARRIRNLRLRRADRGL